MERFKILTHPVHPAWEWEFSKLNVFLYSIRPDNFSFLNSTNWITAYWTMIGDLEWNVRQRPLPKNIKFVDLNEVNKLIKEKKIDFLLVHTFLWLEKLQDIAKVVPTILHLHTLDSEYFKIPEKIKSSLVAVTANSSLHFRNFNFNGIKKVIPVPVDTNFFSGYIGDIKRCLVVYNFFNLRAEEIFKDYLQELRKNLPIDIIDPDTKNGLGEAISRNELLFFYRHWAVFLNLSSYLSMSLLEAMSVGMPVILFESENIKKGMKGKFFIDGVNCLIVSDIKDALEKINILFKDKNLRSKIGINARESVIKFYNVEKFLSEWNSLFNELKYKI